jgi:hypothetical protein
MASLWLSRRYSKDPLVDLRLTDPTTLPVSAYAYKKVANKTKPVATTLPENFRIV